MNKKIQQASKIEEKIVIPTFSFWQIFMISAFDIDFTSEKFVPSTDPEVIDMRVSIPKYTFLEMLKNYF